MIEIQKRETCLACGARRMTDTAGNLAPWAPGSCKHPTTRSVVLIPSRHLAVTGDDEVIFTGPVGDLARVLAAVAPVEPWAGVPRSIVDDFEPPQPQGTYSFEEMESVAADVDGAVAAELARPRVFIEPGNEGGPCLDAECTHPECNAVRCDAQRACVVCHQTIGYGRKFIRDGGDRLAHEECYTAALEGRSVDRRSGDIS